MDPTSNQLRFSLILDLISLQSLVIFALIQSSANKSKMSQYSTQHRSLMFLVARILESANQLLSSQKSPNLATDSEKTMSNWIMDQLSFLANYLMTELAWTQTSLPVSISTSWLCIKPRDLMTLMASWALLYTQKKREETSTTSGLLKTRSLLIKQLLVSVFQDQSHLITHMLSLEVLTLTKSLEASVD